MLTGPRLAPAPPPAPPPREQWDWDAMLTKQVKPPPLAKTYDSEGNVVTNELLTTPQYEDWEAVHAEVNSRYGNKPAGPDGARLWDDWPLPDDLQQHFDSWDYISPYTLRKEMLHQKA